MLRRQASVMCTTQKVVQTHSYQSAIIHVTTNQFYDGVQL